MINLARIRFEMLFEKMANLLVAVLPRMFILVIYLLSNCIISFRDCSYIFFFTPTDPSDFKCPTCKKRLALILISHFHLPTFLSPLYTFHFSLFLSHHFLLNHLHTILLTPCRYCLHCRVEYHVGNTCQDYHKWSVDNGMSDDLFKDFVEGHKFKQCVKCKFWVEKTEGMRRTSYLSVLTLS